MSTMQNISIDSNIPRPPKTGGGRPKTTVYPFEALEIDQSFVAGSYSPELYNKVNCQLHYYGNKLNRKFSIAKVCESVRGADHYFIRVWRTK